MRIATLCCLALAGCMPSNEPSVQPAAQGASDCGKEAYVDLVGEPIVNHSFETAGEGTRIIYPSMAVTMDHRPNRLNVDVNQDGDIARLWCG